MKTFVHTAAVAAAIGVSSAFAATPSPSPEPTMAEVMQLLKQQQAEIEALKAKLNATQAKVDTTAAKADQTATAVEATASAVETVSQRNETYAKVADWAERTQIGGYGEIHYNNKENGKTDELDAHRFVMYLSHDFTDQVHFFSEVELEHAVASSEDSGEVELEQAYVQWDYADRQNAKFGQYLVPIGILNETHEPPTFYGVERNRVEARIIPTTWREDGILLGGEIAPGLHYDIGAHSGLKTDAMGEDAFDIAESRQEGAHAAAEDLAYTGRLKYTGLPGLELAVAANYETDMTQGLTPGADKARGLLYETHGIYQAGPFGLRALYAHWQIDGDQAKALGRDEQNGWYLEPSWRFTQKLGVFARYSEWDTAAGGHDDTNVDEVSFGLNYWLVENVVLKADWVSQHKGDGDGLNLGLGWNF